LGFGVQCNCFENVAFCVQTLDCFVLQAIVSCTTEKLGIPVVDGISVVVVVVSHD
jgi:hypothetical protein